MMPEHSRVDRRHFLAAGAASLAGSAAWAAGVRQGEEPEKNAVVRPPEGKRILFACKLGMIPSKAGDKTLSLADRLTMAGQAGFDGVDLDQAQDSRPTRPATP